MTRWDCEGRKLNEKRIVIGWRRRGAQVGLPDPRMEMERRRVVRGVLRTDHSPSFAPRRPGLQGSEVLPPRGRPGPQSPYHSPQQVHSPSSTPLPYLMHNIFAMADLHCRDGLGACSLSLERGALACDDLHCRHSNEELTLIAVNLASKPQVPPFELSSETTRQRASGTSEK
jgi:hypothetical protein